MAKQTHWPRRLKNSFTIRITAAEVIESQLSPEDLKVLRSSEIDHNPNCEGVYCSMGCYQPL